MSNTQLCWEHVGAPQDCARQLRVHMTALHKSPVCVPAGTRHLSWEQPHCPELGSPTELCLQRGLSRLPGDSPGWLGTKLHPLGFALVRRKAMCDEGTRVKRGFVPREPEGSWWYMGTLWQESCTAGGTRLVPQTKGNRGCPKKSV